MSNFLTRFFLFFIFRSLSVKISVQIVLHQSILMGEKSVGEKNPHRIQKIEASVQSAKLIDKPVTNP